MILNGTDYGNVFNSSGARGFYGEGYRFHRFWKPFGLDYTGSTLVTKTSTTWPNRGNMPLNSAYRPVELLPKCIVVKPFAGVVLNSVGLSGPGIANLTGFWSKFVKPPWIISVMPIKEERDQLKELEIMSYIIQRAELPQPFALQLNVSCPNTEKNPDSYLGKALPYMRTLSVVGAPILVKFNVLTPIDAAKRISDNPNCAGLVVSNTIPWGRLEDRIPWAELFGSTKSPLSHLGGGGLSGKPLLPLVCEWIAEARAAGITKPIVGGGGILNAEDADRVLDAGASAIELGSVSILRPWRVANIINHINARLGGSADGRRFDRPAFAG